MSWSAFTTITCPLDFNQEEYDFTSSVGTGELNPDRFSDDCNRFICRLLIDVLDVVICDRLCGRASPSRLKDRRKMSYMDGYGRQTTDNSRQLFIERGSGS